MKNLNDIMQSMPADWRYRWCDAVLCGCLGCANASGGVSGGGFDKLDWQLWVADNPPTNTNNNGATPYIHKDIKKYLSKLPPYGDIPNCCKDETNF